MWLAQGVPNINYSKIESKSQLYLKIESVLPAQHKNKISNTNIFINTCA